MTNIPPCVLCGQYPHDDRCTYKLKAEEVSETLSDNERQLFQERAELWLKRPALVQEFLNITALVTLQKLAKDALIPGGKDPATTSLRAITELVKKNADWMEGIGKDDNSDVNTKTRKRAL